MFVTILIRHSLGLAGPGFAGGGPSARVGPYPCVRPLYGTPKKFMHARHELCRAQGLNPVLVPSREHVPSYGEVKIVARQPKTYCKVETLRTAFEPYLHNLQKGLLGFEKRNLQIVGQACIAWGRKLGGHGDRFYLPVGQQVYGREHMKALQ